MKLLKLADEGNDKDEVEVEEGEYAVVIRNVKIPIFNIAFADSSSNARSSPLMKFLFIVFSFCCTFSSRVVCPCDISFFFFCCLD